MIAFGLWRAYNTCRPQTRRLGAGPPSLRRFPGNGADLSATLLRKGLALKLNKVLMIRPRSGCHGNRSVRYAQLLFFLFLFFQERANCLLLALLMNSMLRAGRARTSYSAMPVKFPFSRCPQQAVNPHLFYISANVKREKANHQQFTCSCTHTHSRTVTTTGKFGF